jgi:uncharacterized protein (TIGR03435 family)
MTRANAAVAASLASMIPFIPGLAQAPTSPSPKPEIDVASIRQNHTGGRSGVRFTPGNGSPVATNVTLKYLIQWAYDVEDYQVSGGPKWIDSTSFDITAKLAQDVNPTGDPAQRAYFREMFQPILADRFKLVFHRSTREIPAFALVVAKNGPKLKDLGKPENPQDMKMTGGRGVMVGQRIPIAILAEALRSIVGRPVEDQTGLKGNYDFRLQWDPAENTPAAPDRVEASIFTAIQEQLGLRLDSRRKLVETLIVDGAELPSQN